jgi:hypothetical protein
MSEAVAVQSETLTAVVPATDRQVERFTQEGATLQERAAALVIADDEGVVVAKAIMDDGKAMLDEIDRVLGKPKKQAHELHRELSARHNEQMNPVKRVMEIIKQKLNAHYDEEARLRRVREAEEAAAQRKIDEQRRIDEAAALEAAGEDEEAEAVLEEPAPAPATPQHAAKVAGISHRDKWSAVVKDPLKLILAAANGDAVAIAILTSPSVVKAMNASASEKARALKEHLKVEGVKVMRDTITSHRG